MIKRILIFLGILSVVAFCGCVSEKSESKSDPPEYIDTLYADKAGPDGIIGYLILADKDGVETTSDGKVTLRITDAGGAELNEKTFNVSKSDFRKATLGAGPFQRDAIIYNFGRVPLLKTPWPLGLNTVY